MKAGPPFESIAGTGFAGLSLAPPGGRRASSTPATTSRKAPPPAQAMMIPVELDESSPAVAGAEGGAEGGEGGAEGGEGGSLVQAATAV